VSTGTKSESDLSAAGTGAGALSTGSQPVIYRLSFLIVTRRCGTEEVARPGTERSVHPNSHLLPFYSFKVSLGGGGSHASAR